VSRPSQAWGTSPVTLQGRHVDLVPLARVHIGELWKAAAAPEIWRYMPVPPPESEADMAAIVDAALAQQAAGRELPFAILERAEGRAIGSTRLLDFQPADRGLEIGWTWLARSAWRSPVNTECKYLLLAYAFETLSALRVQLKTDSRNERSRRAIARIGARFEGILRSHRVLWDGYLRDSAYYSVIAPEWPEVKRALEHKLAAGAGARA
jgi:RimJ/RimL family protein N-acetyltransferase